MADSSVQKEGRILLAMKAFKLGRLKSIRAAAAYNVSLTTLSSRLNGRAARVDSAPNGRKLTNTE
ncbi:uncharacterized protein EURHEDRAFT_534877 [Aspergillus ruber CBS 135680]|uniref:HTH psq-type domain-containing protein n=1 Tax=Aspergillus ruber (strain CBS 135680) TaxID=1388766 RepID=A0A017SSF2_ASPRC|nr:uncharacterized protein EURHEDRAFT_534877 [Aspergillus ruber CBS 135680]EYE99504.1 hypothetical protein EURHEDRAFT_534877 [Aspergillus ruber CBS 135680]